MNYLDERLPPPPLERVDSHMWIDEAIWGHMLYNEQTPWLIYLEFLNVFLDQQAKGYAFKEIQGFNRLKYSPYWRLELRNILFNNPELSQIRVSTNHNEVRWREWHKSMSRAGGITDPDFSYLDNRFHSFDDFADIVDLLRGTGIESTTNKRWTSKYVFPYGKDCIFEDLDKNARTNDRHFFRRTGELLYLFFCRSTKSKELLAILSNQFGRENRWNKIVKLLQPPDTLTRGSERANAFLPYPYHPSYDELAEDWLAILKLGMPGFDALPHLVNLAAFHLMLYQLRVGHDAIGVASPLKLVCEVVAPKKTLVREVSCDSYDENNLLSSQAIMAYIDAIERSEEWQMAKAEPGAIVHCRQILSNKVLWTDNEGGLSNPDELINELRTSAMRRHRQHAAHVHRSYGREIGLVSKRGTIKLRYAPTDDFLKAVLFANVENRIELNQFLSLLWRRYALIFGDKEAERVLPKDEFDKKSFQANTRRLEQRLTSLGFLKRLSDGCAYVINPFAGGDV